jgi:threonine dehydrogenase-like Zn-dependent dehydrogenase
MRVAQIIAPQQTETRKLALPRPGPKQVRVRLEGCGVCGSNLAVWQGRPWFRYPFDPGAPGHEGWGIVDELGTQVDNVRAGDRVALLSFRAYAEYDVADASALVSIPSDKPVFPGEALGCAINVFRRSGIEKGQTVAIVGIGFLGALLVQLAAQSGARVIAVSRRPFALEIARQCGAMETIALAQAPNAIARVMELTENLGCERVIEAAGEQQTLDLAGELVAVHGRLIIAGYHQDGARRVNMQLWNWRGIDVVNAHERDPAKCLEGMRAAVEAVARGALEPSPLYTHSFTLGELSDAFQVLEKRPGDFLKAWIRTDV